VYDGHGMILYFPMNGPTSCMKHLQILISPLLKMSVIFHTEKTPTKRHKKLLLFSQPIPDTDYPSNEPQMKEMVTFI